MAYRNEVDDINFGLSHFYDGYDVVHCRLIAAGVSQPSWIELSRTYAYCPPTRSQITGY